MAPAVRVVDVSKRFTLYHNKTLKERLVHLRRQQQVEDFWALRNVTFEVEPSRTLGLIGPNGSGKSTLLKLVAGILKPSEGYIERQGRVAALLELGSGFHPDLTGRENVYLNASILGLSKRQIDASFDAIVEFSGVERFIDNQLKFYSSGMHVRLAFAVAVHVDPAILLVDEVLAVGDEPFQRKCIGRIKEFQAEGRTIVVVTHGLDLIRHLCDRAVMLEAGEVVVDGTPLDAVRHFRERHATEVVYVGGEADWGSKEVEIVSCTITDGSGNPKTEFEAGDVLGIEVVLQSERGYDSPVIGFDIRNHMDLFVFGTNSDWLTYDVGRVQGPRLVRFRVPRMPLVEGSYTVTIGVTSNDKRTIFHRKERFFPFRVRTDSPEPGVAYLNPTVEVANA